MEVVVFLGVIVVVDVVDVVVVRLELAKNHRLFSVLMYNMVSYIHRIR